MRLVILFALLSSSAFGQVNSLALPAASGVTVIPYRPITTLNNAGQFAPTTTASGSSSVYAISMNGGTSPTIINGATSGPAVCEFDAPLPNPLTSITATPLNGYCHWDAAVVSDSDVCAPNGVLGRVLNLRPDLGPNFAEVTLAFPGRKGTKQASTCISDFASAVKANQNTSAGPAGAAGSDASISVGTTTTGAAGSSASVSNSGTSNAAVFNFTIPQGIQGVAGAASTVPGPAGPTGPSGAASTVAGPQGPQGVAGTPATPNTASLPLVITSNNIACATCLTTANRILGTTSAFGGALLALGGSSSGTATVTGATLGSPCFASPSDGVRVAGTTIDCAVTAINTATVYITAFLAVTPTSKTYRVVVEQ